MSATDEIAMPKVLLEVVAGVIPEQPASEYTRRWGITVDEWDAAGSDWPALLAERNGQAVGYAQLLMAAPDVVNWVRVDWLWL